MLQYQAPLDEFDFVAHRVLHLPPNSHLEQRSISGQLIRATLEVASEISQALLNLPYVDLSKAQVKDNGRSALMRDAYREFYENGWPKLTIPQSQGGLGFPRVASIFFNEIIASSNITFSALARMHEEIQECVKKLAGESVKELLCGKLASGEWLSSICIWEPGANGDVGKMEASAILQGDGRFLVTGVKSAMVDSVRGMAGNVIYIVLAYTVDEDSGNKRPCLLAVPKYIDDSINVISTNTGRLELHAGNSFTCLVRFDRAVGFMIGDLQRCLPLIKPGMCRTQLAIGVQMVGLAETAYQNAFKYSQDCYRMSGLLWGDSVAANFSSSLGQTEIHSLLKNLRHFIEPARLLCTWISSWIDRAQYESSQGSGSCATGTIELLAPIVQGFVFEEARKSVSAVLPLLGGCSSDIREGLERLLTESSISIFYEELRSVQAVLFLSEDQNQSLKKMLEVASEVIGRVKEIPETRELGGLLETWGVELRSLSSAFRLSQHNSHETAALISPDVEELVGVIVFAYLWAWIAESAYEAGDLKGAKLHLARLYFETANVRIDALIEKLKLTLVDAQ